MVKKIKRRVPSGREPSEAPATWRGLCGQRMPAPAHEESLHLELECGACGHADTYAVGSFLVSRRRVLRDDAPLGDDWGFTGYVLCGRCGGGDTWRLTDRAILTIIEELATSRESGQPGRIIAGESRLFDGTVTRFGAQAVAHLEALVAADPQNAFLRDKLGNALHVGGRPDLARAAWEAALALGPDYLPSLYSLGRSLLDHDEPERAVPYLHRCLTAARASPLPPDAKRELVEAAIDASFEAYNATDGRTPLLPATPSEPGREPRRLEIFSLDLSDPRDLRRLADFFLR
jgi:tetratricopeptide (TPR) repeat protein